jgi:hypothetical protein
MRLLLWCRQWAKSGAWSSKVKDVEAAEGALNAATFSCLRNCVSPRMTAKAT